MIDYAISIKYMLTGYAAIFVIQGIYLVSFYLRWQKLKRDLHSLEEMEKQD